MVVFHNTNKCMYDVNNDIRSVNFFFSNEGPYVSIYKNGTALIKCL